MTRLLAGAGWCRGRQPTAHNPLDFIKFFASTLAHRSSPWRSS